MLDLCVQTIFFFFFFNVSLGGRGVHFAQSARPTYLTLILRGSSSKCHLFLYHIWIVKKRERGSIKKKTKPYKILWTEGDYMWLQMGLFDGEWVIIASHCMQKVIMSLPRGQFVRPLLGSLRYEVAKRRRRSLLAAGLSVIKCAKPPHAKSRLQIFFCCIEKN